MSTHNVCIIHLFILLIVALPILLPLSSYSSNATDEQQDDAAERRQQHQDRQRERYLNRLYWEMEEEGEEGGGSGGGDSAHLWKDIEDGRIGAASDSARNVRSRRLNRDWKQEEPLHPWDAAGDDSGDDGRIGRAGDGDGDGVEDEHEDFPGQEGEEEKSQEEAKLEDKSAESRAVANRSDEDTVDQGNVAEDDEENEENEENEEKQIMPSRVVLADIRTILEVNVRKVQEGFLPQKVIIMLNEMEKNDANEDGGGDERIRRQHLCWAFMEEEDDIWPENEYPCYEWYKPRATGLYSGFDKHFDAAMRLIKRVEVGEWDMKETYTMQLRRYRSIGNMSVSMKRPGGTLKKDWSRGISISKYVNCRAKGNVECFMRPKSKGKEILWG